MMAPWVGKKKMGVRFVPTRHFFFFLHGRKERHHVVMHNCIREKETAMDVAAPCVREREERGACMHDGRTKTQCPLSTRTHPTTHDPAHFLE